MSDKSYDILKEYKNLKKCTDKYSDFYEKSQGNYSVIQDLIDAANNILKSDLFSPDYKTLLKKSCENMINGTMDMNTRLEKIKQFKVVVDSMKPEMTEALSLTCLSNIKHSFDEMYESIQQSGFSDIAFNKFVEELNVYLFTDTKDAISLYNELKVPVLGLHQMYQKNKNINPAVLQGCLDDIKKYLNGHINFFQKQIGVNQSSKHDDWADNILKQAITEKE